MSVEIFLAKSIYWFKSFAMKFCNPMLVKILAPTELTWLSPLLVITGIPIHKASKVVVPALSWATDYSPVIQLGFKPILCDVNLKDLSIILHKLLNSKKIKKNSNIFNVGFSDENYTKRDIIQSISKHLPKNKKFKFVEKDFFDKRNYRVNFDKIKSLGAKKNINLQKGIKEIINYLKNYKQNLNNKVFYNHK